MKRQELKIFFCEIKELLRIKTGNLLLSSAENMYRMALAADSKLRRLANPSPSLRYLGDVKNKTQGSAAQKKINLILEILDKNVETVADIGGNNGFFSVKLAQHGKLVYCLEPDRHLRKRAFMESLTLEDGQHGIFIGSISLNKNTVSLLPQVDAVLLLSVAHYWVQEGGWDHARKIIEQIWSKTNKYLFFEIPNPVENTKLRAALSRMGHSEETCKDFIERLLQGLPSSKVTFLDYIITDFRPDERRHLFLVSRLK